MHHVVSNEGGDEIIGMIVARLHPHVDGDARCGARVHETGNNRWMSTDELC